MDGLTISNGQKFIEAGGLRSQSNEFGTHKADSTQTSQGPTFAETLKEAVGQVNELQKTADVKAQELATGKTDDVAGVMLASEKADIALRTMVQVRNKIIDAYQEIMRMQV